MNVDTAISQIGFTSYTRPTRYQVEFSLPRFGFDNERLTISCETITLPGKAFATDEHHIYGPPRKIPYARNFTNALACTFRVGRDWYERSVFEDWNERIYDRTTNDMNYYHDYIGTLIIRQLDHVKDSDDPTSTEKTVYGVQLSEVYPESIEEMTLSQEDADTYNKATVNFSYHKWEPLEDTISNQARSLRADSELTAGQADLRRILDTAQQGDTIGGFADGGFRVRRYLGGATGAVIDQLGRFGVRIGPNNSGKLYPF